MTPIFDSRVVVFSINLTYNECLVLSAIFIVSKITIELFSRVGSVVFGLDAMSYCGVKTTPTRVKSASIATMTSSSLRKINRMLINIEWGSSQLDSRQWCLHKGLSDYCAIKLSFSNLNWGPMPFKFLDCWLHFPNFLKKVS